MPDEKSLPLEIFIAAGSKATEALGTSALMSLGSPVAAKVVAPALITVLKRGVEKIWQWSSQGRLSEEIEKVANEEDRYA